MATGYGPSPCTVPASPPNDVFVSYAHRDNEAFGLDRRRWVSTFRKDLATSLGVHLGREAAVWMDPRQPGELDFAKDIAGQLTSTAILVAVLSPSYIQSAWCCRELTEFAGAAAGQGGLFVENGCRILKVFKLPVERSKVRELNPDLDKPKGFHFFETDSETGVARELSIHENPQVQKLYDPRVDDVAQAACRVISGMGLAQRAPKAKKAGTVYLAETTEDLTEQSLKLKRELEARGYDIVPQHQLPVRGAEAQTAIQKALQRARCSIHLFGARAGWIPEGERRSVVTLQHELASRHDGDGFTRFLWIPPGLVPAEPAQEAFLESVREHPGSRPNFELAEVPFEELKAIILEKLSANGVPAPAPPRAHRVYLVCDACDDPTAEAMAGRLIDLGLSVETPLRDVKDGAKDHLETLKRADVVAVLWAASSLAWVRQQLRELQDLRDGAPPGPAVCLVLGGADTEHKQRFRAAELDVIRIGDANDVQPLMPVVERAPSRRGTPR